MIDQETLVRGFGLQPFHKVTMNMRGDVRELMNMGRWLAKSPLSEDLAYSPSTRPSHRYHKELEIGGGDRGGVGLF